MLWKVKGSTVKGKGRCFCGHITRKQEMYYIISKNDNLYAMCRKCIPAIAKAYREITSEMVTRMTIYHGSVTFIKSNMEFSNAR